MEKKNKEVITLLSRLKNEVFLENLRGKVEYEVKIGSKKAYTSMWTIPLFCVL